MIGLPLRTSIPYGWKEFVVSSSFILRNILLMCLSQGWKGNVKARHFILALRDYFHEKYETDRKANVQESLISLSDKWAFQYIDVPYLQPILEAVDDDASGFIRISEVNAFTTSRPKDWRYA